MTDSALGRARECFEQRRWAEACVLFEAAGTPLEASDFESLAVATHMLGREAESRHHWELAHQEWLRQEAWARAVRAAFWLAFELVESGAVAEANGWIGRASRILDDQRLDSVERGYLLVFTAFMAFAQGRYADALAGATESGRIARRFGDRDLQAMSWHGHGRVLIRQGDVGAGIALLDETMVTVTADEVSPPLAGDLYCGLISACQELFDLRRAREWTEALGRWCSTQPDLVAYRGECLVRRAELMFLHGTWTEALDEARRAGDQLNRPSRQLGAGSAFYLQAEIHRLRGEVEQAESAYRRAAQLGARPEPGLGLLRLARGDVAGARGGIERALEQARERRIRARLLGPAAEIFLADHDLSAARHAAEELAAIATELGAPMLRALATGARGAVLLAEDRSAEAWTTLRESCSVWEELEAPYEASRIRALIALAASRLGDTESARMELDAARPVFRRLGAGPDLERLARVTLTPDQPAAGMLSPREQEVLRLLATGKTNRVIAEGLGISVKTVDRHVSNILTKLGLSNRAGATAYALRHHLV